MNNIKIPSFINEIMCDFEEKEIKDKNIKGFYNLLKNIIKVINFLGKKIMNF